MMDGSALKPGNMEGITFGPNFNGKRTLILVADNNFSRTSVDPIHRTGAEHWPKPNADNQPGLLSELADTYIQGNRALIDVSTTSIPAFCPVLYQSCVLCFWSITPGISCVGRPNLSFKSSTPDWGLAIAGDPHVACASPRY